MEAASPAMSYRVEIGPQAEIQLDGLDTAIGASVDRKILWLSENAGTDMLGIKRMRYPMDVILQC